MSTPDAIAEEVARELLAVHEESYGPTAENVRVHLLDDDVVVFLDGIELQRNEQFLVDKGRSDLVLNTRTGYQQSIEGTFRAIVEHAAGRTVTAFLSAASLDPPFSVEMFRLAPLRKPADEPAISSS